MKKKISVLFIVMAILASPVFMGRAHAVDVGIGIMSYYALWQPSIEGEYDNFKIDPLTLYGPVISLTFFQKLTFTGLFIIDYPSGKNEFDINFTGSNGGGTVSCKSEFQRSDLDLSLSYAINSYINFFVGYKMSSWWLHYTGAEVTAGSYSWTSDGEDQDSEIWLSGPAAGFSISIPLSDNLALTPAVSIFYAKTTYGINKIREQNPGIIEWDDNDGYNAYSQGINTTLNLSYYFESINTSISIGGRYQYMTYTKIKGDLELKDDYFYGVTLSAMYYF